MTQIKVHLTLIKEVYRPLRAGMAFHLIRDAHSFHPSDQPSLACDFHFMIQDGYSDCKHLTCFSDSWKKKNEREYMPIPFKAFPRSCLRLFLLYPIVQDLAAVVSGYYSLFCLAKSPVSKEKGGTEIGGTVVYVSYIWS